MDNRMGLAQAMAGQGGPPPTDGAPKQMQPPDDPLQQILAIVMKISDQLDNFEAEGQPPEAAEAPVQGPPQG